MSKYQKRENKIKLVKKITKYQICQKKSNKESLKEKKPKEVDKS